MPRGKRGSRGSSKRGQAGSSKPRPNQPSNQDLALHGLPTTAGGAPVQKRRRIAPARGSEPDQSWRRSPSPLSDVSNEASDISNHNDPHGPYIPLQHAPPATQEEAYIPQNTNDSQVPASLGVSEILQALTSNGSYHEMVSQEILNQLTALMSVHGNPDSLLQLLSAALQEQQSHQQQPTFQEQQEAFKQILQSALGGTVPRQETPMQSIHGGQPLFVHSQGAGSLPNTHAGHGGVSMAPQNGQGHHLTPNTPNYQVQTNMGGVAPIPQATARSSPMPPQTVTPRTHPVAPIPPQPSPSTQEAASGRVAQRSVMEAKKQKEIAIEKARDSSSYFVGRDSEYDNFIIPSLPRAAVLQRLPHNG